MPSARIMLVTPNDSVRVIMPTMTIANHLNAAFRLKQPLNFIKVSFIYLHIFVAFRGHSYYTGHSMALPLSFPRFSQNKDNAFSGIELYFYY